MRLAQYYMIIVCTLATYALLSLSSFPYQATMDKEDEEPPQGPPVQDSRTLVNAVIRDLAQVGLADFSGSSSVERVLKSKSD